MQFTEEGLLRYALREPVGGRDDYNYAYSNISDSDCVESSRKMVCKAFDSPESARKWYEYQLSFSGIEGSNVLPMQYLHLAEGRVLFDYFEDGLADWLKRKYSSKKPTYWEQGDRWWKQTRNDFFHIFGPIFKGLRSIHSNRKYHGNLHQGIVIRKDKGGCLFNMCPIEALDEDLEVYEGQAIDCSNLREIITQFTRYPYKSDAPTNAEVFDLCLLQLRGWSLEIDQRWSLNPALFWGLPEKVKFLRALHRVVYKHNDATGLIKKIARKQIQSRWKVNVKSKALNDILTYETGKGQPDPYRDALSKLLLWRNAQEHFALTERNVSCTRIHEEVSKEVEFFAEAVRAMDALIKHPDEEVKSHIPSFFEEMGW